MSTPIESIVASLRDFAENNTGNAAMYRKDFPGDPLAEARAAKCDEMSRLWTLLADNADAVLGEPDEQPQDERDARIAELEREVRQLRAGAPRAWTQDLRSPLGRFENFVNATRSHDSDHLGGIMRGGNAEATITLGDLRAVLARLAELESAQDERDGDVRAVAEACSDFGNDEGPRGIRQLYARFADRFADLNAREAKGGE